MKTNLYRIFSLVIMFAFSNLSSATLRFQCKDLNSNNIIPVEIIDVIVANQNRTKSLTTEPFDSNVKLFPGKNYIHIFGNGYIRYIDSVYVDNENEVIDKIFYLEKAIIESTPEEENYHSELMKFAETNSLLRIKIDSLKIIGQEVFAFITFENISPLPIYILKTIGCIEPVEGIIFDENREHIKKHAFKIDCVGEKVYPNSCDLILIPNNTEIAYPKYHIYKYKADKLLPGTYYLQIKYEYVKPEYFSNGSYNKDYRIKLRDKIKAINKTLLGQFESNNIYQLIIN